MKKILITGVSGVGKSTVSAKLREMGEIAHDTDSIDGLFIMVDKKTRLPAINYKHDDLNEVQNMDWICDVKKLEEILNNPEHNSFEVVFCCGSASNYDEMFTLFDQIILLKTNEENMRQRLSTRMDNDFGRTAEVQDWIMTWKDWWESDVIEKKAIVIDANREIEDVVAEILSKSV